MKWTRGTKNDDVIDARGSRGARRRAPALAGGGLAAVIIVALVSQVLGVDISGLLGSSGASSPAPSSQGASASGPGVDPKTDPDAELMDYVRFVMKDIQDTFDQMYREAGETYERAKLVVFTDAIDTACGRSSSAIGPFYCPGDQHAYIDLSFYRDLKRRFGAPGDFAQAYVLAHEVGHHLQHLRGSLRSTTNAESVRVELQADCFAGIWARAAQGKRLLEPGDLEEAITAAAAIGDDRLQRQAGVEVKPETFTHGTSEQRVRWFRRGLEAGRFEACDTYAATTL